MSSMKLVSKQIYEKHEGIGKIGGYLILIKILL